MKNRLIHIAVLGIPFALVILIIVFKLEMPVFGGSPVSKISPASTKNSLVENVAVTVKKLPWPKDLKCLSRTNENSVDEKYKDAPECARYFKEVSVCYGGGEYGCEKKKILACPEYYNPVFDEYGVFYPSFCWAKQLGAKKIKYGISPRMKEFMQDLWWSIKTAGLYTRLLDREGVNSEFNNLHIEFNYKVPEPDIFFSYGNQDEGPEGGLGPLFRSSLWPDNKQQLLFDLLIDGNEYSNFNVDWRELVTPGANTRKKILHIFLPYDGPIIPNEVLMKLGRKYMKHIEEDIQYAQRDLKKPIKFDYTPIVADKWPGFVKKKESEGGLAQIIETESKYMDQLIEHAMDKAGRRDFDTIIYTPVAWDNQNLGQHALWKEKADFIEWSIQPEKKYDSADLESVLTAHWGFQNAFMIIGHEILHALGYDASHIPPENTAATKTNYKINPVTGEGNEILGRGFDENESCDRESDIRFSRFEELPENMNIKVGVEPDKMRRIENTQFPCAAFSISGDYIIDIDGDGYYEYPIARYNISDDLRKGLGWMDIDGDKIAELEDPNPYGGFKKRDNPIDSLHFSKNSPVLDVFSYQSFTVLGEKKIKGCSFLRIKLENKKTGITPAKCPEFSKYMGPLFEGLKYDWTKIRSKYGHILIPTLK